MTLRGLWKIIVAALAVSLVGAIVFAQPVSAQTDEAGEPIDDTEYEDFTTAEIPPELIDGPLPTNMPTFESLVDLDTFLADNPDTADAIRQHNGLSQEEFDAVAIDQHARVDSNGRIALENRIRQPLGPPPLMVPPLSTSDTFLLNSKPNSKRVIFLDFDGHSATNSGWGAYNVGPWYGSSISTWEHTIIQNIWLRVAEDFAPFDVNVTTEDPGQAAITRSSFGDDEYGTRALITPQGWSAYNFCSSPCGGVAFLGVFDLYNTPGHNYYQPAIVHGSNDNAQWIALVVSHEVGHNLGLTHDGQFGGTEYYGGHGVYQPIMGAGLRPITQWSKGEYASANNQQDDLRVMASNGTLRRADDHANTRNKNATSLRVIKRGIIHDDGDIDVFRYPAQCAETLKVRVVGQSPSPNLDIRLKMHDANGTQVRVVNPAVTYQDQDTAFGLNATISLPVTEGGYYFSVEGVAARNPLSTGYTGYGSLGAYTLRVTTSCPPPLCDGEIADVLSAFNENGTNGNDIILGTRGNDTINAKGGNDIVCAQGGNDTIDGGSGNDAIYAGNGNDVVNGGTGDDLLRGQNGNDVVNGGAGRDNVHGNNGNDTVNGGDGNDYVSGQDGKDTVTGGAGNDTLNGGGEADILKGGSGNDLLNGNAFGDTLQGGVGNDTLNGGDGPDDLRGEQGNDTLVGNRGNDSLNGGQGNDSCDGKTGFDTGASCESKVSVP